MQYGAMNFPVMPLRDEIDRVAAMGFDFIEISMDAPMAHYKIMVAEKAAISQQLRAAGLSLVCHLPTFVSTADLTPGIREASQKETLRSLEVAAEFEPMKISVHPAMVSGLGHFVKETVVGYALEFLDRVVRRAGELGLVLCLENMFPRYGFMSEPEAFAEILKQHPDLFLLLDVGHARLGEKSSARILRFIELLGHRLGHLHLSDNKGERDDHLPLGSGTIDFKRIARALKTVGYDATATLEVFNAEPKKMIESRDRFDVLIRKA
jgi:sugar phosphate isomerase/epimerase